MDLGDDFLVLVIICLVSIVDSSGKVINNGGSFSEILGDKVGSKSDVFFRLFSLSFNQVFFLIK